jgi:hypothetical protein
MHITHLLSDSALGLIGGYVGTKVMEPVSMKLYELEPEAERQQEDRVRPGPPYEITARKTAALLGLQLTDKQVEQAGLVFHYGLGMSWGTVYTLLRRLTPLVGDGLTPLLGTSRAEPFSTQIHGFVAHLVYGLSAAAVAESGALFGRNSSASAR